MSDTPAAAVIVLLFGAPVSLLVATAGLAQFKAIFVGLTTLAQRRGGIYYVQKGDEHADPTGIHLSCRQSCLY